MRSFCLASSPAAARHAPALEHVVIMRLDGVLGPARAEFFGDRRPTPVPSRLSMLVDELLQVLFLVGRPGRPLVVGGSGPARGGADSTRGADFGAGAPRFFYAAAAPARGRSAAAAFVRRPPALHDWAAAAAAGAGRT